MDLSSFGYEPASQKRSGSHRIVPLVNIVIWFMTCWSAKAVEPSLGRPLIIEVDASHFASRVIRSHLEIPVSAASITLSYPLWSPGDHAPFQTVGRLGSLNFHAGGHLLLWRRDLVAMQAFHLELPSGTRTVQADFDFLLPLPGEGLADSSANMLMLRWNLYTLYVAGQPVQEQRVRTAVRLPAGWQFATALPGSNRQGDRVTFADTSLETLVDSPVLTGRYLRTIDLTPGSTILHEMDVAAESSAALPSAQEVRTRFGPVISEAKQLFGTEHYRSYRFLIAASDYTGPGSGFEHQESSDNRVPANYFQDGEHRGIDELLVHEYVHSWNGKSLRPLDLYPSDYQKPERTDLLWVYEGLTNYYAPVLVARSGLSSTTDAREQWAERAAKVENETGRTWRNLQDTIDAVPVTMDELFSAPPGWDSWLRGMDYYDEGPFIWLEVDDIIRRQTANRRTLDDFTRLFLGGVPGYAPVRTYTAAAVYAALNKVAPYNWSAFFKQVLQSHSSEPPFRGLEAEGWRLVLTTAPNAVKPLPMADLMNSIGLSVAEDGTIRDVKRGGPADTAGLFPGAKLTAVGAQSWSSAELVSAIVAASRDKELIPLVAEYDGVKTTYRVQYEGGLRSPHLERVPDRPDWLSDLLRARVLSR